MTLKIIKHFPFSEPERHRIQLVSGEIRLHPTEHSLQLKPDVAGDYPLTADIRAKTWASSPKAARQWIGFSADVQHVKVDGTVITAVRYRLSDGVDEYWWDGAAWVVNTTNWNTEIEVAANIDAFPIATQTIQVVVNLSTTDKRYTPKVKRVKILYDANVDFREDLIWRSLLPALRAGVRPVTDFVVEVPGATSTIDLDDYVLPTPYNVVGVDSVFNHSTDPGLVSDLLVSYDSGTKVITLSSPLSAGQRAWIKLIYEPEVAVTTSRDYSEIGKVPAIVITDFREVDSKDSGADDYVISKATGEGWKVPAPRQIDIELVLRCITDKAKDQIRLSDEVQRYLGTNPLLTSKALDESYRVWLIGEYGHQGVLGQEEVHAGTLRFRIANALFYDRPAEQAYGVMRFNITGTPDVIVS